MSALSTDEYGFSNIPCVHCIVVKEHLVFHHSSESIHPKKKKKKKRSDKVEHTMLHCSEFRQQHLLVTNHTIYWVEKEFSEEKSKAKVF